MKYPCQVKIVNLQHLVDTAGVTKKLFAKNLVAQHFLCVILSRPEFLNLPE